jgi:glyoxylase-like metal-dependent hydrolase (beta-lactamase superfamily II)
MIEVTGVAQREAWTARLLPPAERVRPGLWSVPVPMPDSPLRYVLMYVFELPDGVAVVDTGWPTDEAWAALVAGLDGIGAGVAAVRAVLVTHFHSDHHGLSGRLRAASGAWVGMHRLDAALVRQTGDPGATIARMREWVVERGGTARDAVELSGSVEDVRRWGEMAEPDRLIEDGDEPLAGLRAVWTPGHTPGHLCFYDERRALLLSGDHVLPRISPNISLSPGQSRDPLRDFLASLAKAGAVPAEEVLPAHEWRFRGLRERTEELAQHHDTRLREVEAVLAERPGATTWEVAKRLTWSRTWPEIRGFIRRSALGETLAHLVWLENEGLAKRADDLVDAWTLTGPPRPGTDHPA